MQPTYGASSAADDFLAHLKGEFRWAEGKITYLGTQTRPILTVVFSTPDAPTRRTLEYFTEFQAQPHAHSNDRLSHIRRFTVPPALFRRVIPNADILVDKQVSSAYAELSFTVIVSVGDAVKGREFSFTRENGEAFYKALMSAFEENKQTVPEPLLVQFRAVYP
jgi:hypothetical protein